MLRKFHVLTGLAFALTATAVAVAPSQAQRVPPSQNLVPEDRVNLMYGHPMLRHLDEMDPEAVAIGRVVGDVGGILSIKFMDAPVTVGDTDYYGVRMATPNWHVMGGDDVVLAYKDGAWHYVADGTCVMSWISRLKLVAPKAVAIDWKTTDPVALPPVQPSTAIIEPAPAPEPIRGMW